MDIIASRVSMQTEDYKQNTAHYEELIKELCAFRE